jgi:hypothetical protein
MTRTTPINPTIGDGVACEGRKRAVEPTCVRGERELRAISSLVRQASQDSLRATEYPDALRLTPLDSPPYEAERIHGTSGEQRSLIRDNPHKILLQSRMQGVTPRNDMMAHAQLTSEWRRRFDWLCGIEIPGV